MLGLAENDLGQFNLLKKPLLELGGLIRCRTPQRLESFAALLHGVFGKLGHFLEDFSSLGFALFGGSLGCLTPAEKGPLGGPHVADDLLTQTGACAGKRLDGLINNPHIVRVADVSLQCGGVDPNPARLDRPSLQQLLDQMLVETADPIFTKSLIELNQGRRVRDWIHQAKPAKIPPRKSLPDFPLHFFVAQAPAKFQVHHPKIDPYGSAGTAKTLIKSLFKGLEQLRIGQKLINLLQFFVQFIQRSIDKTITKTYLLRYWSAHASSFTPIACSDPRNL